MATNYREILRLAKLGYSQRSIAVKEMGTGWCCKGIVLSLLFCVFIENSRFSNPDFLKKRAFYGRMKPQWGSYDF